MSFNFKLIFTTSPVLSMFFSSVYRSIVPTTRNKYKRRRRRKGSEGQQKMYRNRQWTNLKWEKQKKQIVNSIHKAYSWFRDMFFELSKFYFFSLFTNQWRYTSCLPFCYFLSYLGFASSLVFFVLLGLLVLSWISSRQRLGFLFCLCFPLSFKGLQILGFELGRLLGNVLSLAIVLMSFMVLRILGYELGRLQIGLRCVLSCTSLTCLRRRLWGCVWVGAVWGC